MLYNTDKIGWQRQLARDTGLAPSTLNDVINRRVRPTKRTALKLEAATGVEWIAWIYPERYDNPYLGS